MENSKADRKYHRRKSSDMDIQKAPEKNHILLLEPTILVDAPRVLCQIGKQKRNIRKSADRKIFQS